MFLLLALLACKAEPDPITEIGNPEMDVAVRAVSTMPDWVGTSSDAVIQVDAVWMALGPLEVVALTCDDDASTVVDTPRVVELVAGETSQRIEVAEADYCGLRQRTASGAGDLPDDAPDELATHSVVVLGTDARMRPFEVAISGTHAFTALGDRPFSITENRGDLLLTFDLARWFAGIDLVGASEDSDGVVRLSDPGVARVDEQLEDSVQLLEDLNSDGQADPNETAAPLGTSGAPLADSDGDGLLDDDETDVYFTDPSDADSDGDTLSDGEEVLIHQTDPNDVDTDGGGATDDAEINAGTDPLDAMDDR